MDISQRHESALDAGLTLHIMSKTRDCSVFCLRPFRGWTALVTAVVSLGASVLVAAADNPQILRVPTPQGHDIAYSAVVDSSGNFYVAGLLDDRTAASTFGVAKFSAQGQLLWRRNYAGSQGGQFGFVRHLAIDAAGNVLATGTISLPIADSAFGAISVGVKNDVLTVKFDSDGVEQWARRYNGAGDGDDGGVRVATDANGNVYVGGASLEASTDWLLLKYDTAGNLVWRRHRDGATRGNDRLVDLQLGSDNQLAVAGFTEYSTSGFGMQATIAKFDANGNEQWSRNYLASAHRDALPMDLALDNRNNVLVTGLTSVNLQSAEHSTVPFAIKYTSSGALQIELNGATAGGAAVDVDTDGQILLAGAIGQDATDPTFSGAIKSTVNKYDPQGNRLWSVSLGAPGTFDVARVRNAVNDNVFVVGSVLKTNGSDYVVRKLNADGLTLWEQRYNATGSSNDDATDLVVDNEGRALVLGSSSAASNNTAYDLVALLYDAQGAPAQTANLFAPSNLTVTSVTRTAVNLSFNDTNSTESSSSIERCAGAGCTNFVEIARVPANAVSYTDLSLNRRTPYRYRVRALRTDASPYSNIATATTR